MSKVLKYKMGKEVYNWSCTIPRVGEEHRSEEFTVDAVDDCKLIFIVRKSLDCPLSLDTVIEKTNPVPTKACITIRIRGKLEKTINVTNWTNICYIKNLKLDSIAWDIPYDISFEIKWVVPTAVESQRSLDQSDTLIGAFFTSPSVSDVTIVLGDNELYAHRAVLSEQSPVFKRILKTANKGLQDCRIYMYDISIDVMKQILVFLYTRKEEAFQNPDTALSALKMAQEYEITTLRDICIAQLSKNLSLTNVLEVYLKSYECEAVSLETDCLKLMLKHKKEIIAMDYFETLYLTKPFLMLKFIKNAINES